MKFIVKTHILSLPFLTPIRWKIQLLIWKMTTSDWSMIFSFCHQCPVGEKTHIPVGNADVPFWRRYVSNWKCDFRIGSETFYLEYKFLLWKCNFPIRKSSYSFGKWQFAIGTISEWGVCPNGIFLFLGALGRGSVPHSRFRRDPAQPDPTRPAISTGSFPDRKVSIWGRRFWALPGPSRAGIIALGLVFIRKS